MDMLENEATGMRSIVGAATDEIDLTSNVIEIDESDQPEIVEIYSNCRTDDYCEIIETIVRIESDNEDDIVEILSEYESGSIETVKTHSEGVSLQPTISAEVNNFVEEETVIDGGKTAAKLLTPCYVDLHSTTDPSEVLNCKRCNKLKFFLAGHRPVVKGETSVQKGKIPRECNLCHNLYSSKRYLKYHACAADKGDDRDFNRNYFMRQKQGGAMNNKNKAFRIKAGYATDKPFICSECKKTFKELSQLNQHYRGHIKAKRYECGECGEEFSQFCLLKRHKSGKHLKNQGNVARHRRTPTVENKPCRCVKCGQIFKTSWNLECHQSSKTGCKRRKNFSFNLRGRKREFFLCEKCGKTVKNHSNFKKHLRIHSKKKRLYDCQECGKIFQQSRGLRSHLKFHIKEKRYVCNICEKGFKFKKYLRAHQCVRKKKNLMSQGLF